MATWWKDALTNHLIVGSSSMNGSSQEGDFPQENNLS